MSNAADSRFLATMCASEPRLCFITNRLETPDSLPGRVERILAAGTPYVMLREKDLAPDQLTEMALKLAEMVGRCEARLIVNSGPAAARAAGAWGLQLPFEVFLKTGRGPELAGFNLGVSIHSLEEALEARRAGADYLLAGHIFATDCKLGQPGRGLDFLRDLRRRIDLPLWAVGGITPANIGEVLAAGADVACVRSSLTTTPDPAGLAGAYLSAIQAAALIS